MARDYLTLKEAAAEYHVGPSTMSRLVRRLQLSLRLNPRDRRSKLVARDELESALRREPQGAEITDEWRQRTLDALERADALREEQRRSGRRFTPISELLAYVRGDTEDDHLR